MRSVYIDLIVASLLLLVVQFLFIPSRQDIFSSSFRVGIANIAQHEPFLLIWFFIIWLISSFVLAFLFGYFWDPLHYFMERLVQSTGTLTEDPLYLIRTFTQEKRVSENNLSQLWVRPRMKDGGQYQGEFVFGGYRSEETSREIVLSQAIYYPPGSQQPSKKMDFVFLDTSNCIGVDFIIVQPDNR